LDKEQAMGALRTAGKVMAGAALGTLGALVATKMRDDSYVAGIWETLEQSAGAGERFTEDMIWGMPNPARRYFQNAIALGTPLASGVHFGYSGSIRPAKGMPWMSLSAEQIAVKNRGFVWKANVRMGPLRLTGADHYLDGQARMRISLFGLIPVINATGPDLTRSALGRLVVESALLPSALLPASNVRIEGIDDSRFRAVVELQGEQIPLTLTVGSEGQLTEMVFPRWGNQTDDGSFQNIPYGITASAERSFGGYTVPAQISVGWWHGTERYEEDVRLELDWAQYF
jgi:hypothetical protein